jgi:hypothetical protein
VSSIVIIRHLSSPPFPLEMARNHIDSIGAFPPALRFAAANRL